MDDGVNERRMRRIGIAALLGLAGCGKAAVVLEPAAAGAGTPAAAIAAAERGVIPLALPISRVTVTRVPPAAGAPGAPPAYRVAVVPTAGPLRFQAAPYRDFVSRNVLAIRTTENGMVPINVGNTFTDETATRIGQVGAVVAMVARVAAGGPVPAAAVAPPPRQDPCARAELPEFFVDVTGQGVLDGRPRPVPRAEGCFTWSLSREGAAVPGDGSITRAEFAALLEGPEGRTARFWPVPACMTVRFTVQRDGSAEMVSASMTAADPARVHLFPLPEAGTLNLHPVCGADLTDKPFDRWGAVFQSLAAIDAQVQAVGKAAETP